MDASGVKFPSGLLEWAGHRSGGVKRLFHDDSARPTGTVMRTRLLARLEGWTRQLSTGEEWAPRVVLLVGGPGNGKTEAVEFTIAAIDESLGAKGKLTSSLRDQFLLEDGRPAPRIAKASLDDLGPTKRFRFLEVVQDASASDPNRPNESPASLLVEDLEALLHDQEPNTIYLACINRGVLDDALVHATESGSGEAGKLIQAVVQSAGMSPYSPECWPLGGYPSFAVWPMDVETMVEEGQGGSQSFSVASQILAEAVNAERWPATNACSAGDHCPFCTSRALLSGEPYRTSFLKILRWYEFASGKRWSFRDIYSLFSFLLAGVPPQEAGSPSYDPCAWAAKLLDPTGSGIRRESIRQSAPFLLVSAQYQHAIFGTWDTRGLRSFRRDIKELGLDDDVGLMGLYHFLASSKNHSVPSTVFQQLDGMHQFLDPAIADPDTIVEVSARTSLPFREIDMRFSHSVKEGLQFIAKYHCLTPMEVDVLRLLGESDQRVAEGDVQFKHPATATRVRNLLRCFSCRLVRRTLGVRSASVKDTPTLLDYQQVATGDPVLLLEAAKQVEALLNDRDRFIVLLNTTFGEPNPPVGRRATLTTARQKVRPRDPPCGERPQPAIRYLSVGGGVDAQTIPLTYELFKSVRELRKGLSTASLPRPVIALLDTTRAKLAGKVVRDEESLDGAEIRIGTRTDVIARELGRFLVRSEEGQ